MMKNFGFSSFLDLVAPTANRHILEFCCKNRDSLSCEPLKNTPVCLNNSKNDIVVGKDWKVPDISRSTTISQQQVKEY